MDRCVQLHVCHLNSILDDIDTVCVLELEIATSIKLMLYTKHFKAIQTVALCRKLIKIKQSKTLNLSFLLNKYFVASQEMLTKLI